MSKTPTTLIIMDGYGLSDQAKVKCGEPSS